MVGSLDDLLESTISLREQDTARIIREIAVGLDYAWELARVLHLDLKPSNILLEDSRASRIKVADWGISRLVANSTTIRKKVELDPDHIRRMTTAYSAGTPLFMCPERFTGNWTLGVAADIYSLGLMAIQLNTGLLPFRFGQADPLHEIVTGSYFDNARTMLSERTEQFQKLCLNSIHPDPARRIADYHSLLKQLNVVARG